MNAIKTITKNCEGNDLNATEFLALIRKSNDIWWSENEDSCQWIFRGQWDSKWKLLPKAWRKGNKVFDSIFDKLKILLNTEHTSLTKRQIDYLLQVTAESEILAEFTLLARKLGFKVPEKRIYSSLNLGQLSESAIKIFEDHYSLAQHHGILTRLLDWTENPVYATYFAVGKEFRTNNNSGHLCIWAFNYKRYMEIWKNAKQKKLSFTINIINDLNYGNKYILAQKGLFLRIDGRIKEYYEKYGYFPSLDDIINLVSQGQEIKEPILLKIILSMDEADKLLYLLEREDINLAHLMPSLDKVAETVLSKWS